MDRVTQGHSLRRTSPKGPGQQFVGVCTLCGKEGLTFADLAGDECENVRGLTSDEAVIEAIVGDGAAWPDPTPEMLDDPKFNAIWNVIKTWDIAVPNAYSGYCGATGNHVRAIFDALSTPN